MPTWSTAENTYRSIFADVDGWAIEDGELILSSDGDEVLRYAARYRPIGKPLLRRLPRGRAGDVEGYPGVNCFGSVETADTIAVMI